MEMMKQQYEEFLARMEAEEETKSEGGGSSTSTLSYSKGAGARAGYGREGALILSVIQKLDDERLSVELSMILNFMRVNKICEELNYLMDKVIKTAIHLNNIMDTDGNLPIDANTYLSIRRRLIQIKMHMMKCGVSDREDKIALTLISSAIQYLGHHQIEVLKHVGEASNDEGVVDELRSIVDFLRDKESAEIRNVEGVIDELRSIVDFLIDTESAEMSRIDWLICEAVEMALYVDLMLGTIRLWREAKSIKSRLQGIKLRMLRHGVDGEDPEALVSLVIQQLERQQAEASQLIEEEAGDMKGVANELRMILDCLRERNTYLRRLKYLICDLIEMALYLNEIKDSDYLNLCKEAESVESWLRVIRLRMLKSETGARLEGVGEDGDEEDGVVGLDEQVELVLRRAIFNEAKGLETAVITGMVGIGKTSLARTIYKHAAVVDRFEHRAWVCVSTDLTHKEILMKLVQQVGGYSPLLLEEMDNRSLQHLLHQHLQGVPYLIVLDDLPKQMHLKSFLNNALPDDEEIGSRLLVTSSTKSIPTTIFYTHLVKSLDSDKSWKLFLNTTSRDDKLLSEHRFPKHLEEKKREMLRKCGGLPLAIKEVALQLAEQRRRGCEWEQLLDSINWGSTLALLENFYQQLDKELKSCFLHLALFKENTTMRGEKLLHVLVAGGATSESEIVTYFIKLNRESVIDFKHISGGNRLKSCDINAVLHRLSMKKAEEEIGFEILSSNNASNPPSQSCPRHRVINCSREKFDYSTNRDEHLVSLFFRGGGGYLDASTPSYWKSFELKLKILDLEDFGLKILPESIGTLVELRYLGLRNNYLEKLPPSMVCLKKLEILDVAQNFVVAVPDIIWDMSSLRRVYMSDVVFQKPLKIDALKKLGNVTYISVGDFVCEISSLKARSSHEELGLEEEDSLQTTTSLIRLGIEEVDANSDLSKLFASLAKLDGLEMLVLRGFRFRSMPCLDDLHLLHRLIHLRLEGRLAKLPDVNDFPPYVSYLRLVNTCLDEDPMPVLEQLPHLQHLKLKNAYTGRRMVIMSNESQPRGLKVLCIEELWNLRSIHVGKGAMGCLEKLEIRSCPFLETLPEEIGSMNRLAEFNMMTTRSIATKIRKSGSISKIRVVNIGP